MKIISALLLFLLVNLCQAQQKRTVNVANTSNTWVADNGNGTYTNPVLHADYSDPDAIRVGDDFYMVSSSFEDIPGLPILHSKDLVNWQLLTHALQRQPPYEYYSKTRHGAGVWAPSIRFHSNEFYIYYPDPDFGIYLVKAKKPEGPWSEPVLVEAGKGLIDPCPLWDTDGKTYLVHAYAGSRAGIKSIIVIKQMNAAGTKILDAGKLVYDGHTDDPTIEGPKFYKRNGWYYIFAPAGGVATGWQLVLRSKNIYGPYERKVVMDQGTTAVNGPHQGAWVNTQTGEDWFLHFQDKGAYGRVVHLQPMKWVNDWPVIGVAKNGNTKGEPVKTHLKPNTGKKNTGIDIPAESDEFNGPEMGLQWQWMGNPKATWSFLNAPAGYLRLYSDNADTVSNLWYAPNVLLQKFPAEAFTATTLLTFTPNPKLAGEKAGIAVMGLSYAALYVKSYKEGTQLVFGSCKNADAGAHETEFVISKAVPTKIYLRVAVKAGGQCRFFYSFDGSFFTPAGEEFTAVVGRWKGAKTGIFCVRDTSTTNDAGFADFDWFRMEKPVAESYAAKMGATVLRLWGDSVHLHPGKPLIWTYGRGMILKGFEYLWRNTGDSLWYRTIKKCMDAFITNDGKIKGYSPQEFNIDNILTGRIFLTLYRTTGNEKYKQAAQLLRSQLVKHPRTKEGGFWHKEVYPWQMWLDGLYMGQPFYTEYASIFNEDSVFNDVANQLVWMEQHARDEKSGLLYHGWDESRQQLWADKKTGLSPIFWGRAMGCV